MRPGDQRPSGPGPRGAGQLYSREEALQPGPVAASEIVRVIGADDPRLLVEYADKIGKHLREGGMQTSQIRNVFGAVRRIEMGWPEDATERQQRDALRDLFLLRPKLAYQSARHNQTRVIGYLTQVLSAAIEAVDRPPEPSVTTQLDGDLAARDRRARFRRFVDLFEAIIAYHRYHGGKD